MTTKKLDIIIKEEEGFQQVFITYTETISKNSLMKTYEDGMKRDISEYRNREDLTESWLMGRLVGYKKDFYQIHNPEFRENREILSEFDKMYDKLVEGVE